MGSVAQVLAIVRHKRGSEQPHDDGLRMSGTTTDTLTDIDMKPADATLGGMIGRQGNDYETPDDPRGYFIINQANGDRLQDIANTHLSEGPTPGRIPRQWNARKGAKLGRNITGARAGDDSFALGVTGTPDGGVGDAKYIEHIQIPRGQVIARAFARTVDDAANVPAVYVSDPTRR